MMKMKGSIQLVRACLKFELQFNNFLGIIQPRFVIINRRSVINIEFAIIQTTNTIFTMHVWSTNTNNCLWMDIYAPQLHGSAKTSMPIQLDTQETIRRTCWHFTRQRVWKKNEELLNKVQWDPFQYSSTVFNRWLHYWQDSNVILYLTYLNNFTCAYHVNNSTADIYGSNHHSCIDNGFDNNVDCENDNRSCYNIVSCW